MAGELDKATSDLGDTFAQARAYAMEYDTYVYIGFEELNASQPNSTGLGRVAVVMVAATDGTRPYGNTPGALPATDIVPIAPPQIFQNLHIASAASLSNGKMSTRPPTSTTGFIDLSQATSTVTFQWPLSGPARYTFTKVVEFDPEGVARFQDQDTVATTVPSYIELPLLPTHGTTLPAVPADESAIQIDGMTGAARIYQP